jgi:hypothetical protein
MGKWRNLKTIGKSEYWNDGKMETGNMDDLVINQKTPSPLMGDGWGG